MSTVKRITDLTNYVSVLPYSSEIFGIYQPLLGWKSRRIKDRFGQGFLKDRTLILDRLKNSFGSKLDLKYKDNDEVDIAIKPGVLEHEKIRVFDSVVLHKISQLLPEQSSPDIDIWQGIISDVNIKRLLNREVTKIYKGAYADMVKASHSSLGIAGARNASGENQANIRRINNGVFEKQLQYESAIAGALLHLVKEKNITILVEIFYSIENHTEKIHKLISMLSTDDPIEAYLDISNLNPQDKDHIRNVALSPISVVHLFRQYFFELDTFLGTPVHHVWLSPGSNVELIEVHTRRTITEKTIETELNIENSTEKTVTEQDDISEAISEDNQKDVSFGASVTASYASIDATSSFDYLNSQQKARETTHKRMRQQTEKLSSEIRKNYTSTFKTISEFTDVSSTKHSMANNTDHLINYELRRKMRQVGVQVQDIGTFLCWQTYVDDPGKELGLSKLIHVAKSPNLEAIPHPEEIPLFQPFQEEKMVTIPFISVDGTDADNKGEVYKDGIEVDDSEWFGNLEKIKADFKQEFICGKTSYELKNVEFDPQGKPVTVSRKGSIVNINNRASFILHLDSADFQGQNSIQVKLILHWSPLDGANEAIIEKNKENIEAFKAEEKLAYETAFIENVKDRVTTSSHIGSRNREELREEERISVYRILIQQMLLHGVSLPDDTTRHVVSELINSIFDVEKMLYFVAPDWWRPRNHRYRQQLQENPDSPVFDPSHVAPNSTHAVMIKGLQKKLHSSVTNLKPDVIGSNTVGWGGIREAMRDNYYITKDSKAAKLGSSLGWLLQLDGDTMRNAFLNAPWVKAVIPVRPGREEAAINWLKGVEGLNGITDDVIYHSVHPDEKDIQGNPLEGQKMIDVLMDLAKKIKKKNDEGIETGIYPKADDLVDPSLVDEENSVTSTPIDRVYEHGFYPLKGGFRANVGDNYEIFDQWVEILPTDQIVPVEVTYDPKTGRQID